MADKVFMPSSSSIGDEQMRVTNEDLEECQ